MIYVGDDWAEDHHDVVVLDESGSVLAKRRFPEGIKGVAALHALLAELAAVPEEVVLGIETDRGLWVAALLSAGYQVYAVNPKVVTRYRDRVTPSGAKSDPGDAKVLADLVRTDRHLHRQVAGDSELAEAIKILARSHQSLVWSRQRQANAMRAQLREYYPAVLDVFGSDMTHPDVLALVERAATPEEGRRLSVTQIAAALRKGGRRQGIETKARAIQVALREPQLQPPGILAGAFGATVRATAGVIAEMNRQIAVLESELELHFEKHPDAEIIGSLPGLGVILGARVLGEFGDDPNRYEHASSRRCYAGTAPITKRSGKRKVVLARFVRNRRLGDACYRWAFSSLTGSRGARAFYDSHRAKGASHDQALRVLANRLVGILDGCLRTGTLYDERVAWEHRQQLAS